MWNTESAVELVRKIRLVVQFLKYSSKDLSAALLAVAAFAGASWLGGAGRPTQLAFLDDVLWQTVSRYGSLGLYGLSSLLVILICLRTWRRLTPPPKADDSLQATAIKGPLAFGPHDADLFRRLHREEDIATLLNHILDNTGAVGREVVGTDRNAESVPERPRITTGTITGSPLERCLSSPT
jgi:hypothetical protein